MPDIKLGSHRGQVGTTPTLVEAYWKATDMANESHTKTMEKYTRIVGFSWGVKSPRDITTGQATGRIQPQAVTITKFIDKSSPLIYQAVTTNKNIKESEIVIFENQQKGTGKVKMFTVKMTDAAFASIQTGTADEGGAIEFIEMNFSNIMLRHEVGQTEASWDWSENVT